MVHAVSIAEDERSMEKHMKNRVNTPAVPFELKDAGGTTHRLQDSAGHWLLLVFHRHLG
jgi:peroxiredoxin